MFLTRLRLEDSDTPDEWVVTDPLIWLEPGRGRLIVPAGTMTDLASIPRLLRNLRALDPNGRSRRPAVLHDWLYQTGEKTRAEADQLLRRALLAEGVNRSVARIYWFGVRLGGWLAWRAHRRPRITIG